MQTLSLEQDFIPHFPPSATDDLEMEGLPENPILLDEEQDRENSPSTTPVSVRLKGTSALLRKCPFGSRLKVVAEYVYRCLFQEILLFRCIEMIYS